MSIDWTAQTWTANGVIWLLSIWKGVGWSFIIFLAALDGIPRELLESARTDGASESRVWRNVVLPSIRGAVTFVTVLLVIGAAQVFTQIYEITKGGPYNSTQSLMTYMYQQAFSNFAFGYAAALASLLAVVLFGFSAAEIRILRRARHLRGERGTRNRVRTRPRRRHRSQEAGPGSSASAGGIGLVSSSPCFWRCSPSGPLLYMVSLSFQPNGGLLGATVLIPTHPTVQNYVQAWTENSFSHYFFNSLFVAIATVAITVTFASLAAFAFARYKFPLETVDLLHLPRQPRSAEPAAPHTPVPAHGPAPPAQLTRGADSSLRGVQPALHDLPATWLLRGDTSTSTRSRSAWTEPGRCGCSSRLIVPLSLPAVAVVSMFIFSASWDEFPVALTMINSSSNYTLPVGLADFIGVHTVAWGPFFAASVIATVPVIVVFLISLRWFRSGVSLGAIR